MLPIKQNQNMLDMTVQYTGVLDSLILLAQLNGVSITADLIAGNNLNEVPVVDNRVTSFFQKIEYDCTTVFRQALPPGGIGYMQIQTSFIVS